MKIVYAKEAEKDVKKIKNKKLIEKIKLTLLEIKEADGLKNIKGIKKLSGHPAAYRIRIGDYRLGLYFEGEEVEIARFLKRSDIYKVFPK